MQLVSESSLTTTTVHEFTDAGSDSLKANQLPLGYVHNLSKRTALYGTYAYLKNNKDKVNMGLKPERCHDRCWSVNSGAQHGLQLAFATLSNLRLGSPSFG